jgi:phage shock protein PspC (stress-responsive transcriptional regulator)
MIGGVCGGLGEYFDVDPTFVRLIVAVTALTTSGAGLLAYIVGWIIMPERPADVSPPQREYRSSTWTRYLPGLILIFVGLVLLVQWHWFFFGWGEIWPAVLIVVGLVLIFRKRRSNDSGDSETAGTDTPSSGGSLS